jgi:hypothetical protein
MEEPLLATKPCEEEDDVVPSHEQHKRTKEEVDEEAKEGIAFCLYWMALALPITFITLGILLVSGYDRRKVNMCVRLLVIFVMNVAIFASCIYCCYVRCRNVIAGREHASSSSEKIECV